MADITKIIARIVTADVADAKSDDASHPYLGIAGREFALETPANDLEQGATDVFVFGQDATVSEAEYNDPRKPQLTTEDLDRYPAYVRYTGTDGWCVERVTVTVNPGGDSHVFDNLDLASTADNRRIWLRNDYGQRIGLTREAGTASQSSTQGTAQFPGRRVVFGNVNADGTVQSGSHDFLVTKEGTGRYAIALQTPFTTVPSVTSNIWVGAGGHEWWLVDNTHVVVTEPGRVVITTGDSNGSRSDRGFSFHAIG